MTTWLSQLICRAITVRQGGVRLTTPSGLQPIGWRLWSGRDACFRCKMAPCNIASSQLFLVFHSLFYIVLSVHVANAHHEQTFMVRGHRRSSPPSEERVDIICLTGQAEPHAFERG
jgi:hypothetical protein